MIQKDNTIGITKRDILYLINIVKDISAINKDNTIDDDTKDKRVFATLEDYSIVVDDCDIIKRDLIDIYNTDNIDIKIVDDNGHKGIQNNIKHINSSINDYKFINDC